MTPDYWTLTISQHVADKEPREAVINVYGPPDRALIIKAAKTLDHELFTWDGVLLTDRERTCTRGFING